MVGISQESHSPKTVLEKAYVALLVIIFGGIVVHAPLTVWLGSIFPDYSLLIKSWKEILIIVAAVIALVILRRRKQFSIIRESLFIGIGIYLGTYVLSLLLFGGDASSVSAGLAIDLRYILYFALVLIAVRLYPLERSAFIGIGVIGALIVTVFSLLQVSVLPTDVLANIGYSKETIAPYLTVDQNADFVRINSTLRGPNPLGAYAVIVIAAIVAYMTRGRLNKSSSNRQIVAGVIAAGAVVMLWASYSRSAWIAAVIAVLVVLATVYAKRLTRKVWIVGAAILVALVGVLIASQGNSFVSNVILHENIDGDSSLNSNEGHVSSLADGTRRLLLQPFGAGVGSTGSASLYGDSSLIIENQYLFIAHEVGWLGLAFFVLIFIGVLTRLWQRRSDWLALSVFASGVGLAVIGLFLPVWADDTVSIIWWGLAALMIGRNHE